jgi:hypothetical protein
VSRRAPRPVEPVEFYPVPESALTTVKQLIAAGGLDVGGIEYLEAADGRLIFYDITANLNLRAPTGQAVGLDPFERVVDSRYRRSRLCRKLHFVFDLTPALPSILRRESSPLLPIWCAAMVPTDPIKT